MICRRCEAQLLSVTDALTGERLPLDPESGYAEADVILSGNGRRGLRLVGEQLENARAWRGGRELWRRHACWLDGERQDEVPAELGAA